MGYTDRLFDETIQQVKKDLAAISDVDIIIGIPFYNEGDTLKNVISVAMESLKAKKRKLIVCVGDPAGKEALMQVRQHFDDEVVGFLMPPGANGRGNSIRAILELARFFESDVVLLEADLVRQGEQGIRPEWVNKMAEPIFKNYDMSVARFVRHPFEDIIGKILVTPLIAALYGIKFEDPLSGVFAISHDLVDELCSEFEHSKEYIGGYGINPWLITTALKLNKKICEVNLGAKLSPVSLGKKYIVTKEMLKALFECVKRDEDLWLNNSEVMRVPDTFAAMQEDEPVEVCCNYKEFLDSFLEGIYHFDNLLQKTLSKDQLQFIENMTKAYVTPEYSPDFWAKVVYKFLLADRFCAEILQEDIIELLLAIYNGMLASVIMEVEKVKKGFRTDDIDISKITESLLEGIFSDTVNAFARNKEDFVNAWRQSIEAISPALTLLDYLEFIPGVPIVLPKKLYGRGRREVITGHVFKRLQKKFSSAFVDFLSTIGLDERASSHEIGRRLTQVMEELERTVDSLCPGDLYSVQGTREVVDHIFKIFPHSKVLAVKWQILRKLLQEYPPGNLILRMGYRSLRELLDNMDEREILTLATFTEDKDYFDRIFYWLKDNLRADSFEEVEILPLVVDRTNFHGYRELREISDLNRLTARIPVMNLGKGMGGKYPKLRYFTRIAKSLVEAEHFSGLWKTYARERKEVGRKFVNSILGHYGKAMFSAHHIFENWHHRELVSRLKTISGNLRKQGRERDAQIIDTMIKGYGLSLVLNDGTFMPCSAWTWASFSFKGGEGIPTPLFLQVERNWFNHDLLEEIYKEMGYSSDDVLNQVFQYISQGCESIDLAEVLLGVRPYREEVVVQELDYWPKAKELKRYSDAPILLPIKEHWWESRYVLNTAALRIRDKVYLLYRAFGDDEISRIGLAITDGYRILERLEEPIFVPEIREEKKGCEDPRTVIIDDEILMLYTAYDGVVAQIASASISVDDFLNRRFNRWKRRGLAFPGLWDKDAILFPEKIDGKYVIYHRIEPSIWLAYSDELTFPWPKSGHKIIMGPRSGMMWDSMKIGAGAQPIKTRYGWLLIYHGVDQDMVYRLGVMLADLKDPGRLLYRSPNPTLSPETEYEIGKKGEFWVPNVVFTCGAVPAEDKEILDADDEILVYYGASDTYICLATGTVGDLIPQQVRERILSRR